MARLILSIAILLQVTSVRSEEDTYAFRNGNSLYELCISGGHTPGDPNVMADLYVSGIADALANIQHAPNVPALFCGQQGLSEAQVGAVVCTFLSRMPANRQYAASAIAIGALHEAFPCQK